MNTLRLFLCLCLFSVGFTTASAQIITEQMSMSKGTHEAFLLTLPNTEDKIATDTWSDFIKDFYRGKTKYNRKTKEYITTEVDIAALGMGKPVTLYSKVEEKGNDAMFMLWVDLGDSYLTPINNPERYLEAEKILMRYALEVAKENTAIELEAQEKVLKDMEDELKKLENDREKSLRDIEKAKEDIAKAESDIAENEASQANKAKEIAVQQAELERIREKLKDL